MSQYGLGWLSGEYRGLRVISHSGGTAGFTAQVAFLPDAALESGELERMATSKRLRSLKGIGEATEQAENRGYANPADPHCRRRKLADLLVAERS
jgi:hypothetical protein